MIRIDRKHIRKEALLRASTAVVLRKATTAGIAEAEALLIRAQIVIERDWRARSEQSIVEILDEVRLLDDFQGTEEQNHDLAISIIASILIRFSYRSDLRDLTSTTAEVLRAARIEVDPENPDFDDLLERTVSAVDDIEFWVSNHILEQKEDLEKVVEEALSASPDERVDLVLEGASDVLEKGSEQSSNFLAALWAYRTYNTEIVKEAAKRGLEELEVFNNPRGGGPDAKTTPFCRGVHGKRLSVARLETQARAYSAAMAQGDSDLAKAIYPLQSGRGKASKVSNLGPPPYHGLCRTILRRPRTLTRRVEGPRG